jgi:hypothetical protein
VLGRFGTKNRTVILNPRLEEIMGLPAILPENTCIVPSSDCSTVQAQRAIDALLSSNKDVDNRTSDSTLKEENTTVGSRKGGNTNVCSRKGENATVRSRKGGSTTQRSKKRKRSSNAETVGTAQLGVFNTDECIENADILRFIHELEPELEFGDGSELNSGLQKSSLMCDDSYFQNYSYNDFLRTNLSPEDLFPFDT